MPISRPEYNSHTFLTVILKRQEPTSDGSQIWSFDCILTIIFPLFKKFLCKILANWCLQTVEEHYLYSIKQENSFLYHLGWQVFFIRHGLLWDKCLLELISYIAKKGGDSHVAYWCSLHFPNHVMKIKVTSKMLHFKSQGEHTWAFGLVVPRPTGYVVCWLSV